MLTGAARFAPRRMTPGLARCPRGAVWYIPSVANEGRRTYTDDELEAILRRALERQSGQDDGFGHEELVAAAREVGLDEDAVERAIAELSHERTAAEIRASIQAKRRQRWVRHLVTYLAVVGGFLGLHLIGLVGMWVYWMAFGWGIGLALDTYGKLRSPTDEEVDRERQRLNRKERRRRKAEARLEERRRRAEERAQRAARQQQRSEAGQQLERVIEEGVALLLTAAAKKIREATEQMERGQQAPDTEFGRYVARQRAKGAEPATSAAGRPPQVRVDVPSDDVEELEEERASRRDRQRTRR